MPVIAVQEILRLRREPLDTSSPWLYWGEVLCRLCPSVFMLDADLCWDTISATAATFSKHLQCILFTVPRAVPEFWSPEASFQSAVLVAESAPALATVQRRRYNNCTHSPSLMPVNLWILKLAEQVAECLALFLERTTALASPAVIVAAMSAQQHRRQT